MVIGGVGFENVVAGMAPCDIITNEPGERRTGPGARFADPAGVELHWVGATDVIGGAASAGPGVKVADPAGTEVQAVVAAEGTGGAASAGVESAGPPAMKLALGCAAAATTTFTGEAGHVASGSVAADAGSVAMGAAATAAETLTESGNAAASRAAAPPPLGTAVDDTAGATSGNAAAMGAADCGC